MKAIKLVVKTKTQSYPIIIGLNLISKISNLLRQNTLEFKKCLIVIDDKLSKKFVNKIKKCSNLGIFRKAVSGPLAKLDKALGYEPGDSRFEFWAVHQKGNKNV